MPGPAFARKFCRCLSCILSVRSFLCKGAFGSTTRWRGMMQVALVKAAGRLKQQIWKTTLSQAPEVVQQQDLSPFVLVICNVRSI